MTSAIGLASPIRLLAASRDGASLVAVHETSLSRVTVSSGAVADAGPVPGVVYACAVTPDGRALLLGTRAPVLVDLDARTVAPPVFKGPASASNAVTFSPDASAVYLAHGSFAASGDCYVYAFDLATRTLRWRCAPTPRDGVTDVACVGDRVVAFGEQGVVVLLDPARGASLGRVQLTPPAPYGEAMVHGAPLDGAHVIAATLKEAVPLVARVRLEAGALPITWQTPIEIDEASDEEGFIVGRPLVARDTVHVPVRWSDGTAPRVTLFALDAATGEHRGECDLDGCVDHRAALLLPDGRVAWADGSTVRIEAIEAAS